MPVYRLDLRYDGSRFRGYARQEGQRTIQGELERALETLFGVIPETSVAGRTDAGVHARGQVVSFRHEAVIDVDQLMRSLNGLLGPEIAMMAVSSASDDFDARHSTRWRRYRYLLNLGPAADPLLRHYAWHPGRALDIAAMEKVAPVFVGEHDFGAFCRSAEGRSNVRRVEEAHLNQEGHLLEFWIRSNAFCHQMVRSLVGYLYDVGRGFSDPDRAVDVLESGDRSQVVTVAPPHGLTLWEVGY